MREAQEEIGYRAEILKPPPGYLLGTTGSTILFLMRPLTQDALPSSSETSALRCETPAWARELVGLTTSAIGRERDLAILNAALAAQAQL